ncbi:MAG: MarR family transcriptional regulator [Ruminiclostridium sp.]|nr:MarR family transcriptional regulator [Ruminiclostridium sp.]
MDTKKENISEQIQDLLKQINTNISHVLSKVIEDLPLTAHQMYIMKIILKSPSINLKTLCNDMLLSKSSMSLTLNKLVEGGYVLRSECPHDRRNIDIKLTEKGERILSETTVKVRKILSRFTNDYTTEELETIKLCLEKLYFSTSKIVSSKNDLG